MKILLGSAKTNTRLQELQTRLNLAKGTVATKAAWKAIGDYVSTEPTIADKLPDNFDQRIDAYPDREDGVELAWEGEGRTDLYLVDQATGDQEETDAVMAELGREMVGT